MDDENINGFGKSMLADFFEHMDTLDWLMYQDIITEE